MYVLCTVPAESNAPTEIRNGLDDDPQRVLQTCTMVTNG